MAGGVPPAHSLAGLASRWPRDWLDFDRYLEVHTRYMEDLYRDGFVQSDELRFERSLHPDRSVKQVLLSGTVHCSNAVDIDVTKYMTARYEDGQLEVISTYYRYHAWRATPGSEPLVRYDPYQTGEPHYHRFGPDGEPLIYEVLTLDAMPRLDAVIREAVDLARAYDLEPQ